VSLWQWKLGAWAAAALGWVYLAWQRFPSWAIFLVVMILALVAVVVVDAADEYLFPTTLGVRVLFGARM
jgi:hypothetical protein